MKYALNLLFFTCSWLLAAAQPTQIYELSSTFEAVNLEGEDYNDLYQFTQVLVDDSEAWTYEEVLSKDQEFKENTTRRDGDIEKVFWVKLQLRSAQAQRALFSAGYLFGDYAKVDVYYEFQDSVIIQHTGSRRRAAEKAIRRMGSYFWVDVPADTLTIIYLRIDNANWSCDCWDRNPVSIYHIDTSSIIKLPATYILSDFSAETEAMSNWEPGGIVRFPGERSKPNFWLAKPPRVASLGRYFEFYADPTCNQTFQEVLKNWDQRAFFRYFKAPEFARETCHWARLKVYNPKPYAQSRIFAYWDSRWEHIEYYQSNQEGGFTRLEATPNANNQQAFTLSIPAEDSVTLYIRYPVSYRMVVTNGSMVDVPQADLDQQAEMGYVKFFLVGGMCFFILYFLFQLIVGRQKIVFHYFLMLLGFLPFLLVSLDLTYVFVFTKSLIAHQSSLIMSWVFIVASLLAMIGFLNFTQVSLNLQFYLPGYVKLIKVLIAIEWCFAISNVLLLLWFELNFEGTSGSFSPLYRDIQSLSGFYHAAALLLIIGTAMHAYLQKVPLSGSFLLATVPLALAAAHGSIAQVFGFIFDVSFLPFIVGMFLTLVLFAVLVASRTNLQKEEEYKAAQQKIMLENELLQIESKALRAQMNPHFIFNCLNSIKSLIQEQANKKAIHYLTLFSKFIRNVLQYSEEKHITLEEELKLCQTYLEMEKLRFEKSFSYRLEVAPTVDTSFIKVPPMILQPFLENAIWHGLMHKDGDRQLNLVVEEKDETVVCVIDDNGIGREQAKVLQLHATNQHRSFGTQLTQDRLQVNNRLFKSQYLVNIIDKMKQGRAAGTRVELHFNS